MWNRQNLVQWTTLFRSASWFAVCGFAVGLLVSAFLHLHEARPLQYHQQSVFEQPKLVVNYSRLVFGVIAIPMYVWALGRIEVPSTTREQKVGVLLLGFFGGIFLGVTVSMGIQCFRVLVH